MHTLLCKHGSTAIGKHFNTVARLISHCDLSNWQQRSGEAARFSAKQVSTGETIGPTTGTPGTIVVPVATSPIQVSVRARVLLERLFQSFCCCLFCFASASVSDTMQCFRAVSSTVGPLEFVFKCVYAYIVNQSISQSISQSIYLYRHVSSKIYMNMLCYYNPYNGFGHEREI